MIAQIKGGERRPFALVARGNFWKWLADSLHPGHAGKVSFALFTGKERSGEAVVVHHRDDAALFPWTVTRRRV